MNLHILLCCNVCRIFLVSLIVQKMFLLILSHIQMIYHAVGSGLGLPFKKQLLPVAENNTKKCATDFVLAYGTKMVIQLS